MNRPCSVLGCPLSASTRCMAEGGPFCGEHCSCPAHNRRVQRTGTRRGAPSAGARQQHRLLRDAERILAECIDYMTRESEYCMSFGLHGRSAIVKFVIAVCLARLGWDTLAAETRAPTAVLWASLSDTLGPTRVGHVLDALRGRVDAARAEHLGRQIVMLWSRSAPSDVSRMLTASGTAAPSRERSPRRSAHFVDDETIAEVILACIVCVVSFRGSVIDR